MCNEVYYRGYTIEFLFELEDESGKSINFEKGSKLRFGFKKSIHSKDLFLFKEYTIDNDNTSSLYIKYLPSESKELSFGKYLIELNLVKGNDSYPIFQKEIKVEGGIFTDV